MLTAAALPFDLEAWFKADPGRPGLVIAVICLSIAAFVYLPRLASWYRARSAQVLSPIQLEELLVGAGALVVDLRDARAFAAGHLRGALHVPFPSLSARFSKPDAHAKRAMVLVDETDALSHQAYRLLTQRGYSWVYVLQGGMRAWRRAQRPTVK